MLSTIPIPTLSLQVTIHQSTSSSAAAHAACKLNRARKLPIKHRQVSWVQHSIHVITYDHAGALIRHAKSCWGDEAVAAVQESKNLDKARDAVKRFGKKSQSKLAAALRTVKGWAESFSTQPPSKKTIRFVFYTIIGPNIFLLTTILIELLLHDGSQNQPAHFVSFRTAVIAGFNEKGALNVIFQVKKQSRVTWNTYIHALKKN